MSTPPVPRFLARAAERSIRIRLDARLAKRIATASDSRRARTPNLNLEHSARERAPLDNRPRNSVRSDASGRCPFESLSSRLDPRILRPAAFVSLNRRRHAEQWEFGGAEARAAFRPSILNEYRAGGLPPTNHRADRVASRPRRSAIATMRSHCCPALLFLLDLGGRCDVATGCIAGAQRQLPIPTPAASPRSRRSSRDRDRIVRSSHASATPRRRATRTHPAHS